MHVGVREVVLTVRVTTLKGLNAGTYYLEELPRYYLSPEAEPPGVWHGHGAELLGLSGPVESEAFVSLMAGLDPSSGKVLGLAYGEKAVRGFDVTASAPKSVSVLWAVSDDRVRREVLAAHDAAVGAMVGWIERHAHTRYRVNGEIAIVDAKGIVAAGFRQHTSRAFDPQLHTHVVIANRVRSDDGRWLALDARTIKVDQRTLSTLYHAGLRAELTGRLGVRWRDRKHGIADIDGIPDAVLGHFSARTDDVRRRFDEKLDRFLNTLGREPTPRERWRLEREAVVDSRPVKGVAEDAATLHDLWRHELAAIGWTPERLVRSAVHEVDPRLPATVEPAVSVNRAVSALVERQSSWRPAEIVREVAAALDPVAMPADTIVEMAEAEAARVAVERMVDISRPIPDGTRLRRDGRPVTEAATDRALTTAQILAQEGRLLEWVQRRLDAGGIPEPAAVDQSPLELTPGQVDTATAVAGTAPLVLVVGPAGTGKTTALALPLRTCGATAGRCSGSRRRPPQPRFSPTRLASRRTPSTSSSTNTTAPARPDPGIGCRPGPP